MPQLHVTPWGTNLPTANTVRATEDLSFLWVSSKSVGLNIPSQMIGAFQDVHVWTSSLTLIEQMMRSINVYPATGRL